MGYKSMGECTDMNPCVEERECVWAHTYFIHICVVNGYWWRHMGCCACNWVYEQVFWANVGTLLCKFELLMGGCLYVRVSCMQACSSACLWVEWTLACQAQNIFVSIAVHSKVVRRHVLMRWAPRLLSAFLSPLGNLHLKHLHGVEIQQLVNPIASH